MRWPKFLSTKRKVAASAYVAGMLTFAFFAVPSQYFEGVGVRIAFGAVALLCAAGAVYEWWIRDDTEPIGLILDITPWSQLPTHTRGVAGVWWLIIGSPSGIGSMGNIYDTSNEHAIDWNGWGKNEVMKCELTNLSLSPVVRVELEFRVTFQRSLRQANLEVPGGNQYFGGDVLRSGAWSLMFKTILPGEKVTFYLCNSKDVFVTINPPSIATYEFVGDRQRRTTLLPVVNQSEYLLFNVPRHVDED